MTPSPRDYEEEDWKAWRDHPMTRMLIAAMAVKASEYKERWVLMSWEGGACDERALTEFRGIVAGLSFAGSHTWAEIVDLLKEKD